MASVPSPSPPRRTPPSASDSGNSTSHSPKKQVEAATNNGVFHGDDIKPDFADGLDHLDSTQCIERFRKYDAEYTRRLMAKYFSAKTVYGGNIFDEQITLGDEIIKSSRLPCFRSYADPVVGLEEQCSNGSTPPTDTQVESLSMDALKVAREATTKVLAAGGGVSSVIAIPAGHGREVEKGKKKAVHLSKKKICCAADIPVSELARRALGPIIKDVQGTAEDSIADKSASGVVPPGRVSSGQKRPADESLCPPKGAKAVKTELSESGQSGGSDFFAMENFADGPCGDGVMVISTPDEVVGAIVTAGAEEPSSPAAIPLARVLKLTEKDLNLSFPKPMLNMSVPEHINRQEIVDCTRVIIGRVLAIQEAALAADLRCSAQDDRLAQIGRRVGDLTAEVGCLGKEVHDLKAANKSLHDSNELLKKDSKEVLRLTLEKDNLSKSLDESVAEKNNLELAKNELSAELATVYRNLHAAQEDSKKSAGQVQELETALAQVFYESFNNALRQVLLRYPGVDATGLSPEYVVEGNRLVHRISDNEVVVIEEGPETEGEEDDAGEDQLAGDIVGQDLSSELAGVTLSGQGVRVNF